VKWGQESNFELKKLGKGRENANSSRRGSKCGADRCFEIEWEKKR